MTMKQRLLQKAMSAFVLCVERLSTVVEHVQSMGQNLLNQMEPPEEESPEVWGCKVCGHIFEHRAFAGTADISFCPQCSLVVNWLGTLPYSIEYEDGIYLIDDDGVTTGPYDSEKEAQENLWTWFEKRGQTDAATKKGRLQKGNLRLIAFEGVSIEEDPEEGAEAEAEEEVVKKAGCESSGRGENGEGGGG